MKIEEEEKKETTKKKVALARVNGRFVSNKTPEELKNI